MNSDFSQYSVCGSLGHTKMTCERIDIDALGGIRHMQHCVEQQLKRYDAVGEHCLGQWVDGITARVLEPLGTGYSIPIFRVLLAFGAPGFFAKPNAKDVREACAVIRE